MEFSVAPTNPSSAATISGSRPSDEPASAPAPYAAVGRRADPSPASRSTSLVTAQAWASRWCDKQHRLRML